MNQESGIMGIKAKLKSIRKSGGFTLIELLVVIGIIGILTALLTANFVAVRQRARDSQRKSDLRQIQSALEIYRADNRAYPLALLACGSSFTPQDLSSPVYMQKIPCDPLGSSAPNDGSYS